MKMIIDLDFTSQYRSHKDKHACYCIWRAKWGLHRRIEKLKISTSGTWCSVTPVLLLVSWRSQLGMYSEIEHLTCAWKCEFPQAPVCSRCQEDSFLLRISTFMNKWELEFWNKLFRNVWAQHWVLASSPPALYSATLPGHFNYADAANAAVQYFPQ